MTRAIACKKVSVQEEKIERWNAEGKRTHLNLGIGLDVVGSLGECPNEGVTQPQEDGEEGDTGLSSAGSRIDDEKRKESKRKRRKITSQRSI